MIEIAHMLKILDEARDLFDCDGMDRAPDDRQVIDYIEARVKGQTKGAVLFRAALMGSTQ